jgi:hypothetical protein
MPPTRIETRFLVRKYASLLATTSDFKTHLYPSCRILSTTNQKLQVTQQAHVISLKMA